MHRSSTTGNLPVRLARIVIPLLLLGIVILYLMLVVEPFFRHGLYWQPERAERGTVDPRQFAPFAWYGRGNRLYTAALVLAWFSPPILVILLATFWLVNMEAGPQITGRARLGVYSVLLLGLGVVLFMCTIGSQVAWWLLD